MHDDWMNVVHILYIVITCIYLYGILYIVLILFDIDGMIIIEAHVQIPT